MYSLLIIVKLALLPFLKQCKNLTVFQLSPVLCVIFLIYFVVKCPFHSLLVCLFKSLFINPVFECLFGLFIVPIFSFSIFDPLCSVLCDFFIDYSL